jgi:molybdopterin synthase catalytic subunit
MNVDVLYFATLRNLAGVKQESIELDEGATVADLKVALASRHAELEPAMNSAIVSVNREFAFPEEPVSEGDEIAVFPPVSGGRLPSQPTVFHIAEEEFDFAELIRSITLPTTGASCMFTGIVRELTSRGEPHETEYLEYEAYVPMAEEKMQQVADEIRDRWDQVEGIAIVQRIGHLEPGTSTVVIACSAPHRDMGVFEAARYGIDRLKEIVPIWKKEVTPQGESWVEGEYRPRKKDRRD